MAGYGAVRTGKFRLGKEKLICLEEVEARIELTSALES